MFARILEFVPLKEKKAEFIRVVKKEILPILRRQEGFLEILPLVPENQAERTLAVIFWVNRQNLERCEREWYPRVEQILKPYMPSPSVRKLYVLESAVCERFERKLTA
jgi:Antibiotic biosynthesis monooxygenase